MDLIPSSTEHLPDLKITNTEWNLFATLLSIGHPVAPSELAHRCVSSRSSSVEPTTEFVEFLCSVPDAPIALTSDGLVTVSYVVCVALNRFLSNSRFKRGCEDDDDMMIWSRKRRRVSLNVFENVDREDQATRFRIPNASAKVYIHVNDDMVRSVIMNAGNSSVRISDDDSSDEVAVRIPKHITFDARLLNYGLNEGRNEGEREICMVLSKNSFLGNDSCISFSSASATNISGRLEDCFQFESSSHTTANSHVRIEEMKAESCLLRKKHYTRSCKKDNNKVTSLVKAWINNDSNRASNNSLEKQRFVEGREYKCILGLASPKDDVKNLSNNNVHGGMIPLPNIENRNTLSGNDIAACSGTVETVFCQEVGKENIFSPIVAEKLCTNEAQMDDLQEEEKAICVKDKQLVCARDPENLLMDMDMAYKKDCTRKNSARLKQTSTHADLNLMTPTRELISPDQKHLPETTAKLEAISKDASSTEQTVSVTRNKGNDVGSHIEQKHCREDNRPVPMKQRLKSTYDQKMQTTGKRESIKENREKVPAISLKGNSEPKEVPVFDSYIVEEEEGSGGYGTVYKARRKNDGTTFAVKYPHENANRHNVYNELKMLERFGGRHFVIKYEGSFTSGNSHCLVLEHVAHDRPEVLRKEIGVHELRWYGYCLFKALASLHKQGVVHRDIKPGNFLFSRKANKGYLIDFNLATDLHQKSGSTEKSKPYNDANFGLVSQSSQPESLPPSKSRKYTNSKALIAETRSKSILIPKSSKKKTDKVKDLNMQSMMRSQGADGSGITSTKDATSTRALQAERFRQPIPCTGRKELLNLAHQAIQRRDHEITSTPDLKRKRVAALPAKLDNKFMYLTPMPLQCTGVAVARTGAGLLKYKGEGKPRKEGSCVGTKGYRAPEVCLKSTYQGPKIDVWSAGVTLLYLIIGKSPFVGDPDQNIKEIAKLRGSENLWEVAKLHDRELSFPPELLQVQSLASTKLEEWCKQYTRRLDFLDVIPSSLIDLVDKCLMVNPRTRLSAEEALNHEFFMPCHKMIEQQKVMRQRQSIDS